VDSLAPLHQSSRVCCTPRYSSRRDGHVVAAPYVWQRQQVQSVKEACTLHMQDAGCSVGGMSWAHHGLCTVAQVALGPEFRTCSRNSLLVTTTGQTLHCSVLGAILCTTSSRVVLEPLFITAWYHSHEMLRDARCQDCVSVYSLYVSGSRSQAVAIYSRLV
jgi:hypothetical protein